MNFVQKMSDLFVLLQNFFRNKYEYSNPDITTVLTLQHTYNYLVRFVFYN